MASIYKGKGLAQLGSKKTAAPGPSQKAKPTPGRSANGIATVNVLSTAVSRNRPPADPQTRSDFGFDNLLSFLPDDEHRLLGVYRALYVPSMTLRRWAFRGRRHLGKKIVSTLEARRDTSPREYQFVMDNLYIWGLEDGRDAWAMASLEYDRLLRGGCRGLSGEARGE
ncbi:hypothetical protein CTA2_4014 [Colletotrichum tanaceti]|uniref:Uncharacterized protein n=1 Tax=Colletotrichum tanaceti TaxID=1306861 RepID=A0A4U6XEC1_9PEZI|nr:hypothetical protein CTA2_4014 [Colletotrichum tanaceti]TKW53824.1 hypothetical protein CTA1_7365 [Colletotrichum tanaceti]